jgi:hypothetical protein
MVFTSRVLPNKFDKRKYSWFHRLTQPPMKEYAPLNTPPYDFSYLVPYETSDPLPVPYQKPFTTAYSSRNPYTLYNSVPVAQHMQAAQFNGPPLSENRSFELPQNFVLGYSHN